jgi:cellulose biosynthesis protein BcsQ
MTMFDGRTNLSAQVAAEVRAHLGDRVYATVIPRSVRLSEAPSHGLPIHLYAPASPGATAYRALAEEFRRAAGRRRGSEPLVGHASRDLASDVAAVDAGALATEAMVA